MTGFQLDALLVYLPTVIVVAVAVVLLVVLTVSFRRRLRDARLTAAGAQERAMVAEATLGAAPVGCFAFAHPGGGARCSLTLVRDLGLSEREAADFETVLDAFDATDAAQLRGEAERLRLEGRGFRLRLRHRDGWRAFEAEGVRSFSAAGGGSTETIWFRDVTQALDDVGEAIAERDEFAALLDALPLPVWARSDDLSIIYCNKAYASAVGHDRSTVIAEGVELPGTALAEVSQTLARHAREGASEQRLAQHVVVGGERRLLELSERPLEAGLLLGMGQDLTSVEEARSERDRHIGAHASVLESLSSGIAIFGPDLHLKFFNNAYAQMWQLEESLLSGEPHIGDILEALRDKRRLPEQSNFPAFKEEMTRRLSTLIEPMEELMHIPDGSTLRMTVTPHPFGGVLMSIEDVTDRLTLERSYNTLIAVQRETLNHLYEGVAVYGADGRLKLFNPVFARTWDLPEELLERGPHIRDLVPMARKFYEAAEGEWPAMMESLVAEVTEREMRRERRERADGSVLDTAQVPLPDGNCLMTFLDVTDSIRVERALRERNEALETTDRLKSEFLANVSYELRTPLNAIVGFAEILENQFFGELNERQIEYSRAIVDSSQRLLTLINDILDLATIEAGYLRLDLASVQIADLLDGIRTLGHERAHSRSIDFVVDCAPDIGVLVGDERRLKQALFNLVSNAFKFTPEGGRITVGAERDGAEVRLSVIDTGIGIPLDEQSRVFGKFERGSAQTRQSGAGLGLSLVKSLVELHGGWVELQSAPEQGTRVICHLPLIAVNRPSGEAEGDEAGLPPPAEEMPAEASAEAAGAVEAAPAGSGSSGNGSAASRRRGEPTITVTPIDKPDKKDSPAAV